jgi:DTW domain-containing protein YfiP
MAAVFVFPGEFVEPSRVISALRQRKYSTAAASGLCCSADATWSEARKIFKKVRI